MFDVDEEDKHIERVSFVNLDLPPVCDDYSENYEFVLKVSYLCNLRTIQEGYVNQMLDENLKSVFMDIKNSNALYIA